MKPPTSPKKCVVTILGLIALIAGALCLGGILLGQWLMTGGFARGGGFVLGWLFFWPMAGSILIGFSLLIVGGIVDSIRYSSWKNQVAED